MTTQAHIDAEIALGQAMFALCKREGRLPRSSTTKPKGTGSSTWRPDPIKAKLVVKALKKHGPLRMHDLADYVGIEMKYVKPTVQALQSSGDLVGVYLGRQKDAMTWHLPSQYHPATEAASSAGGPAIPKGDPSVSQGAVSPRQQPGAVVPASGDGGGDE